MINIHDLPQKAEIVEMSDVEAAQITGGSGGNSLDSYLLRQLVQTLEQQQQKVVDSSKQLNSSSGDGSQFGRASAELQSAMKTSSMASEVLASAAKMGDSLATLVRK